MRDVVAYLAAICFTVVACIASMAVGTGTRIPGTPSRFPTSRATPARPIKTHASDNLG